MSVYKDVQEIFVDRIEPEKFIGLDTSILYYNKLEESIAKPLKMILLYGKPGTGKSALIQKIYHENRDKKELFLIDTPITDENEYIKTLYHFVFGRHYPDPDDLTFNLFIQLLHNIKGERRITVLVDEAQLYPPQMLEKMRLISDTRVIKFVVSLHKTDREDLIAKEHFQSRIWETIELKNGTVHDTQVYLQKKLAMHNHLNIATRFNGSNVKTIHRLTKGNYREINKLMYTFFELCDHYENHQPSKISGRYFSNKIIEMAALHLGLIR